MLFFINLLMNVAIVWSNEVVKIPVGDNLENYKYLPEAKLYIDDKEVIDNHMYYEYEIHYTSFNVIRTHIIGTYSVWYRAHFPSLGFESDVQIQFTVYDHIAPTISAKKDIYIDVGTKSIDYKTLIHYADNYDVQKDLVLTIYAAQVNLNQVGRYQVTYVVTDRAFNETAFIQNVYIIDQVEPTIKQKTQVLILVGEAINLDKFFTFSDNYDQALQITLDDRFVDYALPGVYPITIYAKDQSANETSVTVNLTIIDQEAPKIILKTNQLEVGYQSVLTTDYFRALILSVVDNIDLLSIVDVEIISYVDTNYLGKQEVVYQISDSSGLVGETKLSVTVKDIKPPEIILLEAVVVDVNTLEPYIFDYLLITDDYDDLTDLTITKSGSIIMSKIGAYRVIIKVVDRAKNTTEFPVTVEVVDRIAPSLEVPSIWVIDDFLRPNYQSMIKALDNYDKDVMVFIDDEYIDYTQIGIHEIFIIARDTSGNERIKSMTIEIKDLSYPEIILTTQQAYIAYGVDYINYLDYVESIYDSYDKNLNIDDVEVYSNIDFSVIGLYQVIFKLKDQSGNQGQAILYIYINDYEKPIIESPHISVWQNTQINLLSYATAYDNYDGDISHLIKMNPAFIPMHQVGFYELTFYVHDSSGNYAETKVLLTIEKEPTLFDQIHYIIGGVLIVGGLVIYYIYAKKREKL
jgi:hypothetical protein